MKLITASIILVASCAGALKFSQPISQTQVTRSNVRLSKRYGEQDAQKVLAKEDKWLQKGAPSHGSPVQGSEWLYYTTNVSLGTPPQSFRAVVDLGWSDLFVPSIKCAGSRCDEKEKYNSSASSTYKEDGNIKHMTYGPLFAYGKDSIDTLTLAPGLTVPGQQFHELTYYEKVYPDTGIEFFDAALGMAWEVNPLFEDPQARSSLKSPFRAMVEAEVLDENIFSILLPSKETEGDIIFGGYNSELFDGELVQHLLFPSNTTAWQIEVQGVRLGDEILGTGGYTGMLQTQLPLIILPAVIGDPISRYFNKSWTPCARMEAIPCSEVANLPALGIVLNGQEIQLRGEDYVERMWFEECEEKWQCLPLIEAVPDYVPPEQFPRDWIILGSAFLKKVYAVYDWDGKSVGCE